MHEFKALDTYIKEITVFIVSNRVTFFGYFLNIRTSVLFPLKGVAGSHILWLQIYDVVHDEFMAW